MSSDDQQSSPPEKKFRRYRTWREDNANPIPSKTRQRWAKTRDISVSPRTSFQPTTSDTDHHDSDNQFNETEPLSIPKNTNTNSDSSDAVDSDLGVPDGVDLYESEPDNDFEDHDTSEEGSDSIELVHEYCQTSVDEAVADKIELYLLHKWTNRSLIDLLKREQKILPPNNKMPKSLFKLFNYVEDLAPRNTVIKHFYCKKCLSYNSVDSTITECSSCKAKRKDISCFFEIDVRDQIKFMFEHRQLGDKLKSFTLRDDHAITDVTDGSEYIRVNLREHRQKYDLTLMLNTDGVSLSHSSKSPCYPVLAIIAELPDHLRESYLLTIGIWYDNEVSPPMNMLLQPLVLKLRDCFYNGIEWTDSKTTEKHISRVVAPLIIADAPARAQIQNIMNFNGAYGCNLCEVEMQPCKPIEGVRNTRYYPYIDTEGRLRNGVTMERQGREVNTLKSQGVKKPMIKGVKDTPVICGLPLIDIATCLLPEYMHSGLLGVGRQMINLWFCKNGPWKIKEKSQEIDSFLLSIKPLDSFNRMSRRITIFESWKASEFYNWILFYSLPALVEYLPQKYLEHWLLFVKPLYILLQKHITDADLQRADRMLKLFVKQFASLYIDREMTYNIHQLLHYALIVSRWGPLWATSAFVFENQNGHIANSVHGTKHLGQEMVNKLLLIQGLQILKNRIYEQHAATIGRENWRTHVTGERVKAKLNKIEEELLKSEYLAVDSLAFNARARINNDDYFSELYKSTKTNNYTVRIENFDDHSVVYGTIRFFFVNQGNLWFILKSFAIEHTRIFFHNTTRERIEHIFSVKETNTYVLIKLDEIKSILKLIRVGDYICKRPNTLKKVF